MESGCGDGLHNNYRFGQTGPSTPTYSGVRPPFPLFTASSLAYWPAGCYNSSPCLTVGSGSYRSAAIAGRKGPKPPRPLAADATVGRRMQLYQSQGERKRLQISESLD